MVVTAACPPCTQGDSIRPQATDCINTALCSIQGKKMYRAECVRKFAERSLRGWAECSVAERKRTLFSVAIDCPIKTHRQKSVRYIYLPCVQYSTVGPTL